MRQLVQPRSCNPRKTHLIWVHIHCFYPWLYDYFSLNNLWMLPLSWAFANHNIVSWKSLYDIHSQNCHCFSNHAFVGTKTLLPTRICVDFKWFYCLDSGAALKRSILVWVVLYPCRLLGFRKRTQSAEEESTTSVQHITLTEFLKEYVFTRMVPQPCMCGLTRSNPDFILQLIY